MMKGTRVEGQADMRVRALTDNVPLLSAWGNDASFDEVFSQQQRALGQAGDLLIVIGDSGTSPNVVVAALMARAIGMGVVA